MAKRKKKKVTLLPFRQLTVLNPLMQKGGVHETTNKAKRAKDKRNIKKELNTPFFISHKK